MRGCAQQQKAPGKRTNRFPGVCNTLHCAESARRLHIQAVCAPGTLLGVRVINLGAASGSLLPIAGALKDILLVGIAAELLGAVGDVDDRDDVGDQCGDRACGVPCDGRILLWKVVAFR